MCQYPASFAETRRSRVTATAPDSRATDGTSGGLAEASQKLPLHDPQDFTDADRGFVARSDERQIKAADSRVVWDLGAYAFLDGPAPDTASPSL